MKLITWIGLIVFFLSTLFLLNFIVRPQNELSELKKELRTLQGQVEDLERRIREKEEIIEKLRSQDPIVVEGVARDKFGMARQGETIYAISKAKQESLPQE